MDRPPENTADGPPLPEGLEDILVAREPGSAPLLYDRRNRDAWIRSSALVPLAERR
jgi:hypothetical protein